MTFAEHFARAREHLPDAAALWVAALFTAYGHGATVAARDFPFMVDLRIIYTDGACFEPLRYI